VALITVKSVAKLRSRVVREKLKKSEPGNGSPPVIPDWMRQIGNKFGGFIGGGLKRFAGWAFSGLVRATGGLITSAWETLIRGSVSLFTFDFNAETKALQQRIDQNNQSIANSIAAGLGEFAGLGLIQLGTMAVGGLVGRGGTAAAKLVGKIKIPVLSSRIGIELAEERNAQLASSLRGTLETTCDAVAENLLIATTLAFRGKESAKKAGATINPEIDGSLAAKFDRKFLKPLPDFWEGVIKSFLGGFGSGVIQGGYILARNFDDAIAESAWSRRQSTEQITLEIFPDANSSNPIAKAAAEGQPPLEISGTREEILDAVPTALALHESATTGGESAPVDLFLKPGSNRPQLVVIYQKRGFRTRHKFVIPHYAGSKTPDLPIVKAGAWHGFQILTDGSKLACYAATKADALATIKAWSKGVKANLKVGTRPEAKESTAKIKSGELIPIYADYYPQGKAGPRAWRHYSASQPAN
jgi:hypothetical protein